MENDLLDELGRRARAARLARGLTIREVAERSGVSPRFLVDLEAGRGNISVRRLGDLARALETTASALLETAPPRSLHRVVALLGLRGAGKTTVGKRLAKRLRVRFVELDRQIEDAAELSLAEIFSLHGEAYYRRLESDVLRDLLNGSQSMVMATGGGLVESRDTYELLRRSAVTIWLRARPEDHWNRVIRQGDRRPMADHPHAMTHLRSLLASREPLYAAADHCIDTSGLPVRKVVELVYSRLHS